MGVTKLGRRMTGDLTHMRPKGFGFYKSVLCLYDKSKVLWDFMG